MFVWSFKMSKRELIIFAVGIAAFIAVVCLLLIPGGSRETSVFEQSGNSVAAGNAQERQQFLSQFGWEIETEPVQVKEILIPAQFSDVYTEYNALQKSQGFDLEPLRGECVKLWTYKITNYPGASSGIVANILIKDGVVVGGDISSTALDGFMHGFDPNKAAAQTANIQISAETVDRSVPASIPEQSDMPPEQDGD